VLLVYNTSDEAVKFSLPKGEWAVLADGESSMLWQNPMNISGKAEIPAMTALILGKK